MEDNKMRKLYIKQRKEVDELFNALDDFFDGMKEREEHVRTLMYSEMRDFHRLWCKYTQAQVALDNITDVEFDVEDEEENEGEEEP